ncbi:two-component regulator propeller domain-containing protein [Balneolales bacterium ANBcel1]|nr:two-component regulator propeller domain-containing protein [Balneolales bacterium ANBcel1]
MLPETLCSALIRKGSGFGFALLYACLLLPGTSPGQTMPEDISFHFLTDRDGLSQRTVRSIVQDYEGYMWFGTFDGLNRYDGYNITIYRHHPDDPTSISYNEISDVFEDSRNNLWIATGGSGLNRYDRDSDHFIHYDFDYLPEAHQRWMVETAIYALEEGPDGNLWIGTENGIALLDLETEHLDYFQPAPGDDGGLSNRYVTALLTDRMGNVWVGTRRGLNVLPAGQSRFTTYLSDSNDPHSLSSNHIQTIYEDYDGTIWVGTQTGGLNRFDHETENFTSYQRDQHDPFSLNDNSIFRILRDSRGDLWIGTENEGLSLFDPNRERFYHVRQSDDNPFSLNTNSIYTIYESRDEKLWVGTYNGGVNITDLKEPPFRHYRHEPHRHNSLSINSVTSFLEDRDGNIWIGTDGGGINQFHPEENSFTRYRHDPNREQSIPGNVILALAEDHHGNIWMATYRNGLSRYNPRIQTFRHYRHDPDQPNGLAHNDIFTLHFDITDPDLLWIGTNGAGVNILDTRTDTFTHYAYHPDRPHGLNQNDIRHFHQDSDTTMRIGNYGGFLVEFDRTNDRFELHPLTDRNYYSNVVQMIFEDSSGRLWLATWGGGLKLIDRDTHHVTSFTERDGLPNNNLHAIMEDNSGFLWISSNNGLTRFCPETYELDNFGIEDGLQSNEFNPRAAMRDRDGYLYFGGVNGFNRFHPDSLSVAGHTAPIKLSGFRLFNEPVPIGGEDSPLTRHISRTPHLTLSHSQSVITFEFVTLNYDARKNDRYAYKLEGFDDNWNFVGHQRTATYTNLAPGEYRFRVKHADSDHDLSEQEASIGLTVTPPFWRTYWFYASSFLFLIGLVGGVYRYRVYNISQRNRELEEEVAKQTSDLKETLVELQSTRDQLTEKAHQAGMADMATNVLHDIGNILNSVNTSASLIDSTLKASSLSRLKKANKLLRNNMDNIEAFMRDGSKGRELLDYYLKLEQPLANEQEELQNQIHRLSEKVDLIIDVVSAQQNYSSTIRLKERCSPEQLIQNTLTLQQSGFERHDITVVTDFGRVEDFLVEKSKLIHVLLNLLKNARDSIKDHAPADRLITIRTRQDDQHIFISIADSGGGFEPALKNKLFAHGFSTKNYGRGFGLHSCANYVKEMEGSIEARSDGPGKGAEFTLRLPRNTASIKA